MRNIVLTIFQAGFNPQYQEDMARLASRLRWLDHVDFDRFEALLKQDGIDRERSKNWRLRSGRAGWIVFGVAVTAATTQGGGIAHWFFHLIGLGSALSP